MAEDQVDESKDENGAEDTGDDWAAALNEQEGGSEQQTANFDDLATGKIGEDNQNLDFLLDIPLEVSVELGRTKMIVNNLLQLTQGSVVELSKAAADTVEIYVNNKLLGKGEVIVVNERFGVRITEIISQADRVKNMS